MSLYWSLITKLVLNKAPIRTDGALSPAQDGKNTPPKMVFDVMLFAPLKIAIKFTSTWLANNTDWVSFNVFPAEHNSYLRNGVNV